MANESDTSSASSPPALGAQSKTPSPAADLSPESSAAGESPKDRVAWGKMWGAITKAAGQRVREERNT